MCQIDLVSIFFHFAEKQDEEPERDTNAVDDSSNNCDDKERDVIP